MNKSKTNLVSRFQIVHMQRYKLEEKLIIHIFFAIIVYEKKRYNNF